MSGKRAKAIRKSARPLNVSEAEAKRIYKAEIAAYQMESNSPKRNAFSKKRKSKESLYDFRKRRKRANKNKKQKKTSAV